jgi:rfaE bifunctional protein kinase chain/domain
MSNACAEKSFNTDLLHSLPKLKGKKVLVVGDLMVDHYVVGDVERISPEAPVPVVAVNSEERTLGGAGNVAANIHSLGGAPKLIGVGGKDHDGDILADLLQKEGFAFEIVQDETRPTTRKTRIVAHNQQVVRVDWERPTPVEGAAMDNVLKALAAELKDTEVIVLSDYGKGLITDTFLKKLRHVFQQEKVQPKVYVDPKTKNFHLYQGVDLLTPNKKEAGEGAGMDVRDKRDVIMAGLKIFKMLKNKHLLITLGPEGMAYFESPGSIRRIPTTARRVFDVTGAGDTVISVMALAAAAGLDMLDSSILANYAAGIVVGEVGTATVKYEDLARTVAGHKGPVVETWLDE